MFHARGFIRCVSLVCITGLLLALRPAQANAGVSDWAKDKWQATKDGATGAWTYTKGATTRAVGRTESVFVHAKGKVVDGSKASWSWARGKSEGSWDWVTHQASCAEDWTGDKTGRAWAATKDPSGRVSVWARTKVDDNGVVVWTRTALPSGWTWTKDAAGKTWVWADDHKVEIATVAVALAYMWATSDSAPYDPDSDYKAHHDEMPGLSEGQYRDLARQQAEEAATANNYRQLFKGLVNLPEGWEAHHSLPQEYDSIMEEAGVNIHSPSQLRGVAPEVHYRITQEWATWKRELGHTPSAGDVTRFRDVIDAKYADQMKRTAQ